MKTISELNDERDEKVSQLINDCSVFFAFSKEQFNEGKLKSPLQEGEKYVDIGHGGFLPKGKLDKWLDGLDAIDAWWKEETKSQEMRKAHIINELYNHEAFYTGEIEETLDALGKEYTADEVYAVFKGERKNAMANENN